MTVTTEELEEGLGQAAHLLKALSNKRRLHIMCALKLGEKNVGELEEIVDLSQSALSQHLARLRRDGIVVTRRDAQTIYYSMNDKATEKVLECLCSVFAPDGFDEDSL